MKAMTKHRITAAALSALLGMIGLNAQASTAGALIATILNPAKAATTSPARVVGVLDGDTVDLLASGNQRIRCRLYGIDAPEKAQAYGAQSKQSLSDMVFGQNIEYQVKDSDRYGRSICRLFIGGRDVNLEQINRGYAWMYRQYTKDPVYDGAEGTARAARRGLWADSRTPVEPWNWRRNGK